VCPGERPKIDVGGFVATIGQKPWPSAGCCVAAYGQLFMAADKQSLVATDALCVK
jgi:hypothetical protein